MISEFPAIQLPESITRICGLHLKNTRKTFAEITEIIESDDFLKLFIQEVFAKYLKKGGLLGMLTAFGWEGFRNRLAEAYIYYARNKKYPTDIEIDEVNDVIDFERRYDFLFSELNSRVFLLGLYLKLCQVQFENGEIFNSHDFIGVPPEVDEILIKGNSKSLNPDWLIVTVWSFQILFGTERASELILRSKGKMNRIIQEISEDEYELIIASLLRYGFAINDTHFFTEEKV